MIIAGDPAAADTKALLSAAQRSFCPNLVLIIVAVEDAASSVTAAAGGGDGGGSKQREPNTEQEPIDQQETPLFRDVLEASGGGYVPGEGGQAAAYVCFDNACSRPVHTVDALKELL